MAGNIKGIIVEIGGDTSGLQKALKNVNSATSSLSKELRGVNSLLKLDPSNTELVAQKQTLLSKNIEETSEKLKLLKDIQKQADDAIASGTEISEENYRALQREIVNTENKLKTLQSQSSKWSTAGKEIEEFGNKITNVSDKVDKLGNTLTTSLTVPIIGLGTAAVVTGNSFEAQMSRVQAIAGATKDELEQLTNQAIRLGAATSFSATEVAAGMENLASAGFTTNEIMEAMPGLLDLAASSGAELATSSEIAASAIRGFGLEASEAGHVADVFAKAAARTNAQTEDMGEAMKYVAPVAKTVGLSIEETAAAIGIMSDAGIKGSQAGTTLRGALVRIVKPTKPVKEAMEKLNVEFYKSDGTMKSLTEIIDDLSKHTQGLTDETKNQALAQIFGTEALSGMLALVNKGADDLEDMTKSFEKADGAAEEMADTMLDNTAGSLESLSGSVESAGIAIQKSLSPEIRKLAKWIQDLVDEFTNLSEEEQLNIIKTAGLVAGIGPLLKILGTTGKTLGTVTKGFGTFSQAIAVATNKTTSNVSSVNNLAKAMSALTSSTGLLITAFAGITTAAVLYEKHQQELLGNSAEIKKAIDEEVEARNQLIATQNSNISNNLSEINRTKELYDELKTITEENGKVKKGYENRANYITNQLSEALGIEIDLNDGVIDSYKKIQEEIDKLILKKKAEAIVNEQEEAYNNALKNRADAYTLLNQLEKDYQNLINKYGLNTYDARAKLAMDSLKNQIEQQKQLIRDYNSDIALHDQNYSLMLKNTTESLNELIRNNEVGITKMNDDTFEGVTTQISYYSQLVADYTRLKNEQLQAGNQYNAQAYEAQAESNRKQLEQLAEQLSQITTTTNINEPAIQEAWKNIANNSSTVFFDIVSKMPAEIQTKLMEIAGVINDDTFTRSSMGELGIDLKNTYNLGISGTVSGTKKNLEDISRTIDRDKSVENATTELSKDAERGLNSNVDGATWGNDLTREMSDSMTSSSSKRRITSASSTVAGWIADFLHFTVPDKGPLSDMDKSMPDMIELMTKGIYNSKNKLLNATNALAKDLKDKLMLNSNVNIGNLEKMQGNVISKTIDSSKTIFTTPQIVFNVQELDEQKLQQCFNYINKKFGSQY